MKGPPFLFVGFIMTVSRPCYFGNLLLGVVGVDVNLAYILEDVTYYQDSLASYTFLIDNKGRKMHALMIAFGWDPPGSISQNEPSLFYMFPCLPHFNLTFQLHHGFGSLIFTDTKHSWRTLTFNSSLGESAVPQIGGSESEPWLTSCQFLEVAPATLCGLELFRVKRLKIIFSPRLKMISSLLMQTPSTKEWN